MPTTDEIRTLASFCQLPLNLVEQSVCKLFPNINDAKSRADKPDNDKPDNDKPDNDKPDNDKPDNDKPMIDIFESILADEGTSTRLDIPIMNDRSDGIKPEAVKPEAIRFIDYVYPIQNTAIANHVNHLDQIKDSISTSTSTSDNVDGNSTNDNMSNENIRQNDTLSLELFSGEIIHTKKLIVLDEYLPNEILHCFQDKLTCWCKVGEYPETQEQLDKYQIDKDYRLEERIEITPMETFAWKFNRTINPNVDILSIDNRRILCTGCSDILPQFPYHSKLSLLTPLMLPPTNHPIRDFILLLLTYSAMDLFN
jgi:hypothetical protein